MKKLLVAFVAAGSTVLGISQQANAEPYELVEPPEGVEIRGLVYNGTGCPQSSVAGTLSEDRKALELIFGAFTAEASPLGLPSEARKFCQLTVDMAFPQGYSYSLVSADYRGFAELGAAVVGTQTSSYYFTGGFGRTFRTKLVGPFSENYFRRDDLTLEAVVWSPCGASRPLNISTQAAVSTLANRSGSGLMTVDSVSLVVRQTYGIAWRKC
ncbi:DUF4360 domain-containing protein [Polyangium jinanense]|uniref:DUF4360 domain-containing protein n=1 Tax=Polyangium jinanense TaxID=2829994 RepID=A0A9X3WZ98_9BACT|nr:DUF4360 domain-containing protein [Polyangium jinanense]MDC3953184.1 DUF4360 domain-containing protein [Polyangium jinanense]MDC3979695.1 DUF4360 domain-containing protein [Polyangium jinanense]